MLQRYARYFALTTTSNMVDLATQSVVEPAPSRPVHAPLAHAREEAPAPSALGTADREIIAGRMKMSLTTAPQKEDVHSVLQCLFQREDIMNELAPGWSSMTSKEKLMDRVLSVMTDETLLKDVGDSISRRRSGTDGKMPSLDACDGQASIEHSWSQLQSKFPCLICRDVLAAPVVLQCSHSYCGVCIWDYFTSCVSDDVEVVHSCPHCKRPQPMDFRYQRSYAELIEEAVYVLPKSHLRIEWVERRDRYFERERQRERQEQSRNLRAAAERDEDVYESHIVERTTILAIVFAAIALLAIAHKVK